MVMNFIMTGENDLGFNFFQVSTQKEKATKDQIMHLLMKTRMETGC